MGRLINKNTELFPSLFDDFFTRDWFGAWPGTNMVKATRSVPAVNVKDLEDRFELEVGAPGMAKEDFKVVLDNNTLTISAEKEVSNEENEPNYTRREFSYASFSRSFTVSENELEVDKIDARYVDGILTIVLPKKEEVLQNSSKTIEIK